MNMNADKLQASVNAINDTNKLANELHAKFTDAFKPLVGKKVVAANGFLNKAASKVFQAVRDEFVVELGTVCDVSNNKSVSFHLSLSRIVGSEHAGRHDTHVFGTVKNGVLVSLNGAPSLKTDLTVEEFASQYAAAHEALVAAKAALESALNEFRKFDVF